VTDAARPSCRVGRASGWPSARALALEPDGPAARRAVQRARCPDPRAVRPRAAAALGPVRGDHRAGHATASRGDPHRGPGRRHVAATRADRGRHRRGPARDRVRSPTSTRPPCREPLARSGQRSATSTSRRRGRTCRKRSPASLPGARSSPS
jgi:hypothetical protein